MLFFWMYLIHSVFPQYFSVMHHCNFYAVFESCHLVISILRRFGFRNCYVIHWENVGI